MEEKKTNVPTEFEIYNDNIDINKLPVFTLAQLAQYNGIDNPEIYVAIQGIIYDVTSNAKAYGPGKSYSRLVGKDLLRLLGLNSLKQKPDDKMPTWFIEDLNERQLGIIEKWIVFFRKRYRVVGIIVRQQ